MRLNRIVQCTTVEGIYYHLEQTLNLDAVYDEAWYRATRDSPDSHLAKSILMWVTHAEKPFTIGALEQALVASKVLDEQEPLAEDKILRACAGLVRIERILGQSLHDNSTETDASWSPSDSVVALVHPSAHRYFGARRQFLFPHSNDAMVKACLTSSTADLVTQILWQYHLTVEYYTLNSFEFSIAEHLADF